MRTIAITATIRKDGTLTVVVPADFYTVTDHGSHAVTRRGRRHARGWQEPERVF